MKQLLLRQKQVLLFILAGGLSAIVEVGSFKIFSVYLPAVVSVEKDFHGIHYLFSNIFSTTLGIISNYFFKIIASVKCPELHPLQTYRDNHNYLI